MQSQIITARGPHTCPGCSKRLAKGDRIWHLRGQRARCLDCGPHDATADDQPVATPARKRSSKAEAAAAARWPVAEVDALGYYRMHFDSVTDLVRCAFTDFAHGEGTCRGISAWLRKHATGRSSWVHHATKQTIEDSLVQPPADLLAAINRIRESIEGQLDIPQQPRRRVRRGQEFGDAIDTDRYLARVPECWDRSVRELQAKRVVRVGVNLAISGGERGESVLARGASALVLADLLTKQGFSVELLVFSSVDDVNAECKHVVATMTVKPSHVPLDVGSLAFAVCDVAFYRLCMMSARTRRVPGKFDPILGCPRTLPAHIRDELDFVIDKGDVSGEWSAVEWLKQQIDRAAAVA